VLSAMPHFRYKNTGIEKDKDQRPEMPTWGKEESLKELIDKHKVDEGLLVAWPTSRVKAWIETVEDRFQPQEDPEELALPEAPTAASVPIPEDQVPVETAAEECPLEDPVIPEQEEDTSHLPSTREYGDRFHIFDAMPSSRDPSMKCKFALIRRLVIQCTLEFDHDDWDSMIAYLAQKKGIFSLEDVLDHFNFNREWWYRRVRLYPPI